MSNSPAGEELWSTITMLMYLRARGSARATAQPKGTAQVTAATETGTGAKTHELGCKTAELKEIWNHAFVRKSKQKDIQHTCLLGRVGNALFVYYP